MNKTLTCYSNPLFEDFTPNCNAMVGETSSKIWACEDYIYIPPAETLVKPSVIRRMAMVLKNSMYCSRQERAKQFKDIIAAYDGDVFNSKELWFDHHDLCPWEILGIIDSENELKGDISAWWIGAFLRFADKEPALITKKNLSRYELIYLVIAIKFPRLIPKILA